MSDIEQSGFGKFDSITFGLWLNIDQVVTSPLASKLLTLTLSSFHFPLREEHRTLVDQLSGESRRFALNCFTMFTHERRHAHDLLATPYGSMLMRQSTRAALLALACRHDLFFKSDACAVPLSRWVPNAELFEYAYDVQPPSANLRQLYEAFSLTQQKITTFDRGTVELPTPFKGVTATGILEGLAIFAQEHEIDEVFGQPERALFRQSLGHDADVRYYGAIAFCAALLGRDIPVECLNYCLLASLCGDFQNRDPDVPRYPIDLLVQILMWLKKGERKTIYDFFALRDSVDELFEEIYQDDVQGLSIKASKANEQVSSAFAEMVANIEDNGDAHIVLDVFENFRQVQAAFSANIFIEPLWYVGSGYRQNVDILPQPVIFLQCNTGVPIDEHIEDIYYIQTETRINLAQFPPAMMEQFAHLADSEGVIRGAHILSPRRNRFERTNGKYPITLSFEVPDINIELWQSSFDKAGSMLRFLLKGPDSIPEPLVRTIMVVFALVGVRVYSTGGELEIPPIPEDPNDPRVDPAIRAMLADPNFAEALRRLRNRQRC